MLFADDIELWTSVDGALDALMEYINCRRLPYPELPLTSESSSAVATAGSADGGGQDTHDIYVGMYRTAIEMIEEERNSPDA